MDLESSFTVIVYKKSGFMCIRVLCAFIESIAQEIHIFIILTIQIEILFDFDKGVTIDTD